MRCRAPRAWWKQPFLYAIILIRVLPPTALVVPLYKIMLTLNNIEAAICRAHLLAADNARADHALVGFIDGYLGLILVLADDAVAAGAVDHQDLLRRPAARL